MKFILFVEGHTEKKAIPLFLKKWLDNHLNQKVGIQSVRFGGWSEMIKDLPKKAMMYFNSSRSADIIAVIGLLDLYGPTFYPEDKHSKNDRIVWGKHFIENQIQDDRFRMFFAVHEVEAWLLSEPTIFPTPIAKNLQTKTNNPEDINFNQPPSKLLNEIYYKNTKKKYKKVTNGTQLFKKLNPDIAYQKCPNLKCLLDEMRKMAEELEIDSGKIYNKGTSI